MDVVNVTQFNFFAYVAVTAFATFVSTAIVGLIFFLAVKTILKNMVRKSPDVRRVLFSFLECDEYLNLVTDYYLKITEQKEQIQIILKNSIGQKRSEVIQAFSDSSQELDNIMSHYLKSQAEIEKKIFNKVRNQ